MKIEILLTCILACVLGVLAKLYDEPIYCPEKQGQELISKTRVSCTYAVAYGRATVVTK